MSGRFEFIAYDDTAKAARDKLLEQCQSLEFLIYKNLKEGRSRSTALTKLEETYMWIGKAIRDDQNARNAKKVTPQEEPHDG
jgi:hypothetical protein